MYQLSRNHGLKLARNPLSSFSISLGMTAPLKPNLLTNCRSSVCLCGSLPRQTRIPKVARILEKTEPTFIYNRSTNMNYFIIILYINSLHRKLTSLPMCGFIAQLVEHRISIVEVTGSNPIEALILSGFYFPIV